MNEIPTKENIQDMATKIRARQIVYLSRFADTLNRYIDIVLNKDNDSRLEWAILSILIVRGGTITPTQLAKETFRSKHSITRFIDSMVRKGLVSRTHVDEDRRSVNISITQKGMVHIDQTLVKVDKNWQPIMKSLSPEERKNYLELTRKLQKSILEEVNNLNKQYLVKSQTE